MRIQKILNNNVAITRNKKGQECVVTGRGIVFDKKTGDEIDPAMVEKTFTLQERGAAEKLSQIIENIPIEHLNVCDEIINAAKGELKGLSDDVYLSLIDHISFAIERHKKNMDLASSLKWEMKRFYPDEFNMGIKALDIIEKRLNMRLPDDEAAFIAFHLVNAGNAARSNLGGSLRLIKGILEIIKHNFSSMELDENSTAYGRLLIHLKYFSMRVFDKDAPELKQASSGLLYRLEEEFSGESSCVEEIAGFVKALCNYVISNDEKSYLIIHIHSLAVG